MFKQIEEEIKKYDIWNLSKMYKIWVSEFSLLHQSLDGDHYGVYYSNDVVTSTNYDYEGEVEMPGWVFANYIVPCEKGVDKDQTFKMGLVALSQFIEDHLGAYRLNLVESILKYVKDCNGYEDLITKSSILRVHYDKEKELYFITSRINSKKLYKSKGFKTAEEMLNLIYWYDRTSDSRYVNDVTEPLEDYLTRELSGLKRGRFVTIGGRHVCRLDDGRYHLMYGHHSIEFKRDEINDILEQFEYKGPVRKWLKHITEEEIAKSELIYARERYYDEIIPEMIKHKKKLEEETK